MKGKPFVTSRSSLWRPPFLARPTTLCSQHKQVMSTPVSAEPVDSAHKGAVRLPFELLPQGFLSSPTCHLCIHEGLNPPNFSSGSQMKHHPLCSRIVLQVSSVKQRPSKAKLSLGCIICSLPSHTYPTISVSGIAAVAADSKDVAAAFLNASLFPSSGTDETNNIRRKLPHGFSFPTVKRTFSSSSAFSNTCSSVHLPRTHVSSTVALCHHSLPAGDTSSGCLPPAPASSAATQATTQRKDVASKHVCLPVSYGASNKPNIVFSPLPALVSWPAAAGRAPSQCGSQQHFCRCLTYVEARGKMTAAQTMTDPVDILNFFVANADASTALLGTCLRRIASTSSEEKLKEIVKDERFQQLVRLLEARVDDCDARMLTQLCQALYRFRKHTDAIAELGRRVSNVVVRRENAFSPKNIASLVFAFSWLRLDNVLVLHEFLLAEAMKLLAEMEPTEVVTLLEGFRRMGVGSKETTNLLLEKLTDDVDRFTSKDVVALLKAMSSAGTARGFLLRRVATLAFDNLETFHPRQLASILCSLTRLRFATVQNCDQLFSLLRPSLNALPAAALYETLEALTLVSFPQAAAINDCIEALWKAGNEGAMALTYAVAVVYAILQFQLHDKTEMAKELLEAICQRRPPEGKLNNLKMGEVFAAVDLEETCPKVEVPPQWRAAVDQAYRTELERLESSGLHNEVMLLLDSLRGKYQLQIQRNQQAGPYWVEFLDEETKICLDIDSVYSPTTRALKFRHLKKLGYHPILIDSWQWRRLRSEVDQVIFLKQQLSGPLIELDRLDSDILG